MASKSILGLGPKEDNIHILFYNDLPLPCYPDLGALLNTFTAY